MEIKIYNSLPEEAIAIRKKVFMDEQGFVSDFDATDDSSHHLVMFDSGRAVATCRVFSCECGFAVGRIAVIREYRGRHCGASLLYAAEKLIKKLGGHKVIIHAQLRVQAFYQKLGYRLSGLADEDGECPHVYLEKEL